MEGETIALKAKLEQEKKASDPEVEVGQEGKASTPDTWLGRKKTFSWGNLFSSSRGDSSDLRGSSRNQRIIAEARALLGYVAERGLDPDGTRVQNLYDGIMNFERASEQREQIKALREVVAGYSCLTAITYPSRGVNGHTILDTRDLFRKTRGLTVVGTLLLILSIGTEVLLRLGPDSINLLLPRTDGKDFAELFQSSMGFLAPMFWGGLGACIYLLRTLGGFSKSQAFDSRKLHGSATRILLGAVFAVVVVNLFGVDRMDQEDLRVVENISITHSAVAFLCGLGVKAVYASFETLIENVYNKVYAMRGHMNRVRSDGPEIPPLPPVAEMKPDARSSKLSEPEKTE